LNELLLKEPEIKIKIENVRRLWNSSEKVDKA
jgi:hypothetical protein